MKKESEHKNKLEKILIYGIELYNKNSKAKDYKIELDYKIWMVIYLFLSKYLAAVRN